MPFYSIRSLTDFILRRMTQFSRCFNGGFIELENESAFVFC